MAIQLQTYECSLFFYTISKKNEHNIHMICTKLNLTGHLYLSVSFAQAAGPFVYTYPQSLQR